MRACKRLFAILMSSIIIFTFMPSMAFAAAGDIASGTCGTCEWVIDANGIMTITGGLMDDWGETPPWYDYSESIKVVKVSDQVQLSTCMNMFSYCSSLTNIDLSKFDTSHVANMRLMFSGCDTLKSLDVSNFDTSNVSDMRGMFLGCRSLKSLDVSNFDTSNVTDMFDMFDSCQSLTSLDISNFDMSQVTDLRWMFENCGSLTSLDLTNLDTSKVWNMQNIITECNSLKVLKVGNWSSNSIIDPKYRAIFPVTMKDKSTGEVYERGSEIPALSYRTYVSINNEVVTEDMLYGEYSEYLDNQTYNNVSSVLFNNLFAGMSNRKEFDDYIAALKYEMRNGITGTTTFIVQDRTGESAKTMQMELAKELMLSISSDESLAEYIDLELLNEICQGIESLSDILAQKDVLTHAQISRIARTLAPRNIDSQSIIMEELYKLRSHKGDFENASLTFKALGITISMADAFISTYVLMTIDTEIINNLLSFVDNNSDLAKGLIQIQYYQQKGFNYTTVLSFLKTFTENDILDMGEDMIVKYISKKLAHRSLGSCVAIAEFIYWVASYAVPGPMVDEVAKSWIALENARTLYNACNSYRRSVLRGTDKTVEKMKREYAFLINAYYLCMFDCKDHISNCAPDLEKANILNSFRIAGHKLHYSSYISSCLQNANAAYTAESRDGGVVITGVKSADNSKNRKLVSSTKTGTLASYEENENSEPVYIDIPESIDGEPVVGIEGYAFADRKDISAVTLPDSLKSIESCSFNNCTSLDTVFMNVGLTSIGSSAFGSCSSLSSVDIPDSVDQIEDNAFENIPELIISGAEDLAAGAFAESNNIEFKAREKTVQEISVSTLPSKTSYTMDEAIDKEGMTLNVTYTDGSTSVVSEGFGCWFTNERQIGTNQVTVMYGECLTEFSVEVNDGACAYHVFYLDENGKELADRFTGSAAGGETITVHAADIEGYYPSENSQSIRIGELNNVYFTYLKSPKIDIEEADVEYSDSYHYTGTSVKPPIKVTYNGNELLENKDYIVLYGDNIETEGIIEIDGMGDYEGDKFLIFKIEVPCVSGHTYGSWKTTKVATEVATGQKIRTCRVCGKIENKSIPMCKPSLKAVKIAKPKIGKGSVTIKWKKVAKKDLKKTKKILIQYSLDKNFRTGVKNKYVSAKKTSYKIKGLKKGKKYYVHIRAYTKSGNSVHVSKWSSTKPIKVK